MIVKAKIQGYNEWLFWEEFPQQKNSSTQLSEKYISITKSPIQIETYQILSPGFFILHAEMSFSEEIAIRSEIDSEAIVCQFILPKSEQKNHINFSKHNIRYVPSATDSYTIPAQGEFIYFLVILTKAYYEQLAQINSNLHESFWEKIALGNRVSMVEEDLQVTTEMKHVIDDIKKTTTKKELKLMYLNAKLLELLIYQFEQFSLCESDHEAYLKDEDITKLEEVITILKAQFVTPPTHRQLSKQVLLNEFKLRSGFKKYYGTTIHNYITRLRMEEAKRLILSEHKNMYEIGSSVGFKHQASFTHAFKKYYGILPSEIKGKN